MEVKDRILRMVEDTAMCGVRVEASMPFEQYCTDRTKDGEHSKENFIEWLQDCCGFGYLQAIRHSHDFEH